MKTSNRMKVTAIVMMLGLSFLSSPAAAGDEEMAMILELRKIIEQQQAQLEKQSAQVESLQKQIGSVTARKSNGDQGKNEGQEMDSPALISSGTKNVDVNIYGQVNRAIMHADNGDVGETYFVDNSNSSTRLGLNAKVEVSDEFSVGGRIEYEFRSSPSSAVNQNQTTVNQDLRLRHADIFFTSTRFGKFSLGKGSMASDSTSTLDLSGTNVVTNVSVNDMAGSLLWYDGKNTTNIAIKNVSSDLDGGREDRLRYDSPSFAGLSISGSVATEDSVDAALRYSRQYEGAKVAAAAAWQSPNSAVDNIYNGSLSILLNSGLNITAAGGIEDSSMPDEGSFWYLKLGYRTNIFTIGTTSFSTDYGQFTDFMEIDGDAEVFSLAMVQDVPSWGTEFYLAFRQYMYKNSTIDYDDINVAMGGARVKF